MVPTEWTSTNKRRLKLNSLMRSFGPIWSLPAPDFSRSQLRIARQMIVALRSAKGPCFRGAKADYRTVIDRAILTKRWFDRRSMPGDSFTASPDVALLEGKIWSESLSFALASAVLHVEGLQEITIAPCSTPSAREPQRLARIRCRQAKLEAVQFRLPWLRWQPQQASLPFVLHELSLDERFTWD